MTFILSKDGSTGVEPIKVNTKVKLVKPLSGDSEGTIDSTLAKFQRVVESESGDGS